MKNLLSENMLRFGTKNLSESSTRKLVFESIMQTIKEHGLQSAVRRSLLTEQTQVDLLTTQAKEVAAANKSFSAQLAKKIYTPSYLFANKQYYLVTGKPYNDTDLSFNGNVVGFQNHIISQKGSGGFNLPLICNFASGYGGSWNHDGIKFRSMSWDSTNQGIAGNASLVSAQINTQMQAIPMATIQAMYAANPNKAGHDKSIAAFKANTGTFAMAIKAALTGNAKAFLGV